MHFNSLSTSSCRRLFASLRAALLPWIACLAPSLILGDLAMAQAPDNFEAKIISDSPKTLLPGHWGSLAVHAFNYERAPLELEVIVAFESSPQREFSRKIWMPGRARRICWLPVQAPDTWPENGWTVRARFLRPDASGKMVVQRLESNKALFETTILGKTRERLPTLLMLNEADPDLDEFYEALQKVREKATLSPKVHATSGPRPSTPQWLDGMAVLAIADDIDDGGTIESIRRWVRSGGRLWIMADRVSNDTIASLMGDAAPTVVGRETISTLAFSKGEPAPENTPSRLYDTPRAMCLLASPEGRTVFLANDWPALVTQPMNDGEVMVTTVDIAAWPDAVRGWFSDIVYGGSNTDNLMAPPWSPELRVATTAALTEQVGQGVPSRGVVLTILGLLAGGLTFGGVYLMKREQLSQLIWLIPAFSLIATGGLIAIGKSVRSAVPPTIATIQIARVASGTDKLNIQGESLAYFPEAAEQPISGGSAVVQGASFPERTRNTGAGQWTWEGDRVPPGAQVYHVQDEIDDAFRATAIFTERGIEGRVTPPPRDAENVVLAARGQPSLAVHWGEQGDFWATPADTLGFDQHTPATLLSDTGRRRQKILQTLWGEDSPHPHIGTIEMGLWVDAFPTDVQWPTAEKQFGEALIIAPLEFTPLEPGARVVIPGSAMSLQIRSSMFNMARQRWTGHYNGSSDFVANFVLPDVTRTLRPDSAELVVRLSAPGRTVRLIDANNQVIEVLNGPVGVSRIKIDGANALKNVDGRIPVAFQIGAGEGRSVDAEWSIDYLMMHLEGVIE